MYYVKLETKRLPGSTGACFIKKKFHTTNSGMEKKIMKQAPAPSSQAQGLAPARKKIDPNT